MNERRKEGEWPVKIFFASATPALRQGKENGPFWNGFHSRTVFFSFLRSLLTSTSHITSFSLFFFTVAATLSFLCNLSLSPFCLMFLFREKGMPTTKYLRCLLLLLLPTHPELNQRPYRVQQKSHCKIYHAPLLPSLDFSPVCKGRGRRPFCNYSTLLHQELPPHQKPFFIFAEENYDPSWSLPTANRAVFFFSSSSDTGNGRRRRAKFTIGRRRRRFSGRCSSM